MKTLLRHLALLTLILTPLDASFENTQRSLLPANTNPRAPRQGLVFDGTTGGTIANATTIGTADFTVAVWMNLRSTAGSQFILTNSIGTSNLQTSSADLVMYRSTGSTIATNTNPLVANKTQLIVYTRSGTTGQFYVDGVAFEGTKTDTNSYTTFSDIGGVGSASPLNGTLIPFIYNRALSATEVRALYESGAPSGGDYNTASNTSRLTGANSDFSSAGNWTVTGPTTISGGKLNLSNGNQAYCIPGTINVPIGARFRVTLTIDSITAGTVEVYTGSIGGWVTFASTTGTFTKDFIFQHSSGNQTALNLRTNGGNAVVDNALYYHTGLLLAPDSAQAGAGTTWYDTSGNGANITWTSGVSWAVPSSRVLGGRWLVGTVGSAIESALHVRDAEFTPSTTGSALNSSLRLGATSTNLVMDSGIYVGANAYSWFQSRNRTDYSINYPLSLNPNGGNVLIGGASDAGQKLQVSGTGYFVDGTGAATIKARQLGSSFTSSAAVFEALTDNPNTGAANLALGTYRSGDNNYRHIVTMDGGTWWGSGSSSVDTNLYRSAAATLKTDHAFTVGGSLTVSANNALVTLNHQGGVNTKSTIESNAGVSGNYNGMRLASNWTGSAQGNNGLPSWFVDFGGYDGITHGQDKFFVGRAPAGSTTVAKLFQVSGGGDVSVAGTTASTSTTTGALVVSGGAGIAGSFYAGGIITSYNSGVICADANYPLYQFRNTQIGANKGADILFIPSTTGGEMQFRRLSAAGSAETILTTFDMTSGNATFAGTATATQYKTASGTTGSIGSGSATTILSLSGKTGQMYLVHASLVGINDAPNYAAYATVVMDGTSARIVSNNATYMTITLSGTNVQATQTSGVTQQIAWKYTSL